VLTQEQIGIKTEAKLNMKKRASSGEQDQVDDANAEYKKREKTIRSAKIGPVLDGEWPGARWGPARCWTGTGPVLGMY